MGEHADVLDKLLPFLTFHDLADVSKNAERVWLETPVREALRKLVQT
jgi:hypothetical protein